MFSGYLSCKLKYLSCLVIHIISVSRVLIDMCFLRSQDMPTSKLCVSIDMHFFLCKFLHVKGEKLAKTLSNIHSASPCQERYHLVDHLD